MDVMHLLFLTKCSFIIQKVLRVFINEDAFDYVDGRASSNMWYG